MILNDDFFESECILEFNPLEEVVKIEIRRRKGIRKRRRKEEEKEAEKEKARRKKRKKGKNDIKNHRTYSLNTSNCGKMQSRKTISEVKKHKI